MESSRQQAENLVGSEQVSPDNVQTIWEGSQSP